MMYGFGDEQVPFTESVDLLEDLVVEYITEMVRSLCLPRASHNYVVSKDEPSEAVGNRHLHARLSVVCEGQTSSQCPVTSGVPQGTVLGPLLLLLYTTDFPDNVQSSVRLFAVDTLLYGIVASDADCDLLQSDLHVCRLES